MDNTCTAEVDDRNNCSDIDVTDSGNDEPYDEEKLAGLITFANMPWISFKLVEESLENARITSTYIDIGDRQITFGKNIAIHQICQTLVLQVFVFYGSYYSYYSYLLNVI